MAKQPIPPVPGAVKPPPPLAPPSLSPAVTMAQWNELSQRIAALESQRDGDMLKMNAGIQELDKRWLRIETVENERNVALEKVKTLQDKLEHSLEQRLEQLVQQGFEPSIYRRGDVWRVHANVAGDRWAEHKYLHTALIKATQGAEPRNIKNESKDV